MRKSTIYFFIALSLLSLGLTLIPNAFSQTQNIKIVNYSYYVDNMGILDVVGEIQNVGSNTVNPVYLTGSVYSSDGTDQSDSYCQVWVSYLAPQQKAPFYMEFYPPSSTGIWQPQDVSKIALTVSIANATSGYQYPDLKITSSSASIGSTGDYNGAYLVNGIIQNTGSQTATNITVVATFYNSTGTVVAVGYTNYLTPATLAPSGTPISFQVAALDLNQTVVPSGEKISSYSLLVQAQGPILQGTAPIVTPYQGSGSSPSSSSSPTDVNSNNASNPAVIYAIVIVVVLIAVAGTVLMLRKRKPQETVKPEKKSKKQAHR
ncbi:MAG: hypothetical protein ABSB71_12585 [Candidatus Bathyarchaeia archaeon]|jgi:hypothetical protein